MIVELIPFKPEPLPEKLVPGPSIRELSDIFSLNTPSLLSFDIHREIEEGKMDRVPVLPRFEALSLDHQDRLRDLGGLAKFAPPIIQWMLAYRLEVNLEESPTSTCSFLSKALGPGWASFRWPTSTNPLTLVFGDCSFSARTPDLLIAYYKHATLTKEKPEHGLFPMTKDCVEDFLVEIEKVSDRLSLTEDNYPEFLPWLALRMQVPNYVRRASKSEAQAWLVPFSSPVSIIELQAALDAVLPLFPILIAECADTDMDFMVEVDRNALTEVSRIMSQKELVSRMQNRLQAKLHQGVCWL